MKLGFTGSREPLAELTSVVSSLERIDECLGGLTLHAQRWKGKLNGLRTKECTPLSSGLRAHRVRRWEARVVKSGVLRPTARAGSLKLLRKVLNSMLDTSLITSGTWAQVFTFLNVGDPISGRLNLKFGILTLCTS